MSEISCEIIRDLIPSYVDNVCSKESVELVQKHLKECSACSDYYHMISDTQLVADKTNQVASRYLQKIKTYYQRICFAAVVAAAVLVLLMHMGSNVAGGFNGWAFCVLTLVLLAAGSLCQSKNHDTDRAHMALMILAPAMIVYAYALWFLLIRAFENGTKLFFIEPSKIGPVVEIQMIAMAFAELVIFAWVSIKKGAEQWMNRVLLAVSALGVGVLMELVNLLWQLETMDEVRAVLVEVAVVYIAMALVYAGICTVCMLWRKFHRK